jgi:hypothetical protein
VVLLLLILVKSTHSIGALEVGLVSKRFGFKKLHDDNAIAFHGEAGYQAQLLMPGLRFKLWPMFGVKKYPLVQVPAGEIGVVIAQVGAPLPIGAKSAGYRRRHGRRSDRADPREQEQPPQQLSGLPSLPRRRRQDRPPARSAALRRVSPQSVPRARRPRADARGEPG